MVCDVLIGIEMEYPIHGPVDHLRSLKSCLPCVPSFDDLLGRGRVRDRERDAPWRDAGATASFLPWTAREETCALRWTGAGGSGPFPIEAVRRLAIGGWPILPPVAATMPRGNGWKDRRTYDSAAVPDSHRTTHDSVDGKMEITTSRARLSATNQR